MPHKLKNEISPAFFVAKRHRFMAKRHLHLWRKNSNLFSSIPFTGKIIGYADLKKGLLASSKKSSRAPPAGGVWHRMCTPSRENNMIVLAL